MTHPFAKLLCLAGLSASALMGKDTAAEQITVLILGDSLTAGYGIAPEQAYPALLQEKIDADGFPAKIIAAGLSGETTAGGLRRLRWVMQQPADILVVALGGNDGLRGMDLSSTRANLAKILETAKEINPDIILVLAGMQIPPNMGRAYTESFRLLFSQVADEYNAELIPFLLRGVGGDPDLNLPDGIHPNPQGQVIVAENVWEVLRPLLEESEK